MIAGLHSGCGSGTRRTHGEHSGPNTRGIPPIVLYGTACVSAVVWPRTAPGQVETVDGDTDAIACPLIAPRRPETVDGDIGTVAWSLTARGHPETIDGANDPTACFIYAA